MKYLSSVVILALLVISTMPVQYAILDAEDSNETSGRATGVDVGVIDYAFSYTNSVDEGNYRMFSSNHPIIGFNRPANLFVIDAMVDKPIHVDIDVENFGTAPSGTWT